MAYVLCFLVPETHVDSVKEAIFATGAGRIEHYSHCGWQTLGEGQFVSLPGSNAFIGDVNVLERVPEYKVEIVCEHAYLKAAVAALKQAHPYETPAYYALKCEDI